MALPFHQTSTCKSCRAKAAKSSAEEEAEATEQDTRKTIPFKRRPCTVTAVVAAVVVVGVAAAVVAVVEAAVVAAESLRGKTRDEQGMLA